jgi:hypothetical protein
MNYCQDRNSLLEKKWTDQSSRYQKKLLPDYFRIDEKTLTDFCNFAARYGKLISFFNISDRPDGDWSFFFRDDPTISLLFLQSLNTDAWSKDISVIINGFERSKSDATKLRLLKDLVILSTTIFSEIEQAASNIHPYKNFHALVLKYINSRFSPFFLMITETNKILRETYDWRNPLANNFDIAFGSYWFSDKAFVFSETNNWLQSATLTIGTSLPKVLRDIESLKRETHSFLNEEVLKSGNIKPHIALFIAFCDLYQHAQRKLNNISERHLKHYYEEILNLSPLAGNKDSTYLAFNLTKGAGSVQLAKGTPFNYPSNGDGTPDYFLLNDNTALHEGSITNIMAVNMSPQPWLGAFMSRKASEVSVFDLFYPGRHDVELGFEISSQYIVLEEGDRRITFDFMLDRMETIRLKENSAAHFFPFERDKLNTLIAGAWSVFYSNTNGMLPVDEKSLGVFFEEGTEETMQLRFDILIRRHEAALVSSDHDNPEGDAVLKFALNPKGAALYTLFRDLSFSNATLNIAVIGIKDLIVQNDFGMLDNSHPFEPFGPKPVLGANVYIGHKNLFLKPLKELVINLEWNNLPMNEHGFKGYYKAYDGIDDNTSFKVALAGLKDKNWLPSENKQVVDLFTGIPTDTTLANNAVSVIRRLNELDIQAMGLSQEARITGPLAEYNLASTDGFIRMELCYPEAGFGHDQYTELVQKMAFKAVKEKSEPELVNEPYTPSLKSISLEYKSTIDIDSWSGKIRLKKIHPFGSEPIAQHRTWALLPYFPNGGSFFVGLDPLLNNKEISFLFKISNRSIHRTSDEPAGFSISVLEGPDWLPLAAEKITYDSTSQFQRTGILKLQLPGVAATGNVMDGRSTWLRFDLADAHSGYYIEDLHLNAGVATRQNFLQPDSELLPEYAIVSLKDPLIQIEKIEQPYRSFDGQKPETQQEFRLRISERIRHKARAVSNQDMEHLLLSRFPEIQSLKCLNHLNANLEFQPGAATIAVIPVESDEANVLERYFPKEKLMAMQDYLNVRALSGMKISVVNPVYEKIRLKFNVKFRSGYDEKLALKKLHQKIMNFLDPWKSYKIISQGGIIPVTTVLNEIELEEYVDFVTNFSVFHIVNNEIINLSASQHNNLVIKASSPVSVLIPDLYHKLLPFNEKIVTDTPGINDMMIGNDFSVSTTLNTAASGLGFDTIEKTFRLSSESEKISGEKHTFTMYLKD